MSTTAVADTTAVDASIFAMNFARKVTLGLLEDLRDDQWLHAPKPGLNHAAWIAGHLAWSDNLFATVLAGSEPLIPESWTTLVGMKSTPVSDPKAYPSPAELKAAIGRTRETVQRWLRTLSPEQAAEPLPESLRGFASCHGTLGTSIAWHEGLHAGQLSVIRRTLGLPPKFA